MPRRLWVMIVCGVFASMTTACATTEQAWQAVPAELVLPPEIQQPCDLPMIAEAADLSALEAAYMRRGEALLVCDARRALALEILQKERILRVPTNG